MAQGSIARLAGACSLVLCLLLAACAPRNPYRAESMPLPPAPAAAAQGPDRSAYPAAPLDFSRFRSWRWRNVPPGSGALGPEEVQALLAGELDQRGLRPARAGQAADLEVSLDVRSERRIRQVYDDYGGYYGRGPYDHAYGAWGAAPLVRSYEEEVLVVRIELFDPARGQSLWRNHAEARQGDDRHAHGEALRQAIRRALQDYPPR